MREESLAFLRRLVETPSPPGFEQQAQALCRDYVAPYVDTVYKDVRGNQFAVRNAAAPLRVMLDAHVDEVGLMVKTIDDKGFLHFVVSGGVDPAILNCQRVRVWGTDGPVIGVIGRRPPHLTDPEDRGKVPKIHEMWIDIAAKNKRDALKVVAVGDPVTIDAGFVPMRNDKVCARGLDDRLGSFVILEAMRRLAERTVRCAVHCVTAVQEEIGSRGAASAAYHVNPQVALAVEFGWSTDHPSVDERRHGVRHLDKGPVLHRGPNINPVIERQLIQTAKRHKIPYQIAAEPRGTPTDANIIQLTRGGVATGLLRVPGRYLHSPVEIVSLRDVDHAVRLIVEWVCTLRPGMDFIP